MKTMSILAVCAIIAGASAYAMYSNSDANRGCGGCHDGHLAATVEPGCTGHNHDGDSATDESCGASKVAAVKSSCCDAAKTVAVAAKASCCATAAACCPGPCCDDAALAVAGPAALVKVSAVKAKSSCCATASDAVLIDCAVSCAAAGAAAAK